MSSGTSRSSPKSRSNRRLAKSTKAPVTVTTEPPVSIVLASITTVELAIGPSIRPLNSALPLSRIAGKKRRHSSRPTSGASISSASESCPPNAMCPFVAIVEPAVSKSTSSTTTPLSVHTTSPSRRCTSSSGAVVRKARSWNTNRRSGPPRDSVTILRSNRPFRPWSSFWDQSSSGQSVSSRLNCTLPLTNSRR